MLCAAPKVVNRRQYFQVDRSEGAIHTARKFTLEAAKTMSAVCVPSCQPEQHRSAAERVSRAEVLALFALSFNDLLARAHDAHRAYHDANAVQVSTLLSIKTGGCPEDCAYCPQSARYATGVKAEKLMSLDNVRAAGMKTCCGGIVGMGETREARAGLLHTLANLPEQPQSVPINRLVQVAGTPLAGTALLDPFEFVRTIAVARILMPRSMVRLS